MLNCSDNVQVNPSHYDFSAYVSPERWNSYWHQIDEVLKAKPNNVLVIGVGDNIVPSVLKSKGISVSTFDYDKDIFPDYVGDIREISNTIVKKSYDVVLCCQVLEHVEFEYFQKAVGDLMDIARDRVILSLPYNHITLFSITFKFPRLPHISCSFCFPAFWVKWEFDGEHLWEVGTKNFSRLIIESAISKHAKIKKTFFASAFKYHLFYVLTK